MDSERDSTHTPGLFLGTIFSRFFFSKAWFFSGFWLLKVVVLWWKGSCLCVFFPTFPTDRHILFWKLQVLGLLNKVSEQNEVRVGRRLGCGMWDVGWCQVDVLHVRWVGGGGVKSQGKKGQANELFIRWCLAVSLQNSKRHERDWCTETGFHSNLWFRVTFAPSHEGYFRRIAR